jgi:hypothetical protein
MGKGDLGKAAACEWTATNKQERQSKRLDWAFAAHHALLMTGHASVDVPYKEARHPIASIHSLFNHNRTTLHIYHQRTLQQRCRNQHLHSYKRQAQYRQSTAIPILSSLWQLLRQ